jgi:osmotically-inducible protein OsmY
MTTASITGSDVRLRTAVIRQLDWSPEVDGSAIGVTARAGIVTLTGFVDTYAGKLTAERIVKRLRGVRGVANDIVVRLRVDRTDADIARDAVLALKLMPTAVDDVQVSVHNGRITLTGIVEWMYLKQGAEDLVRGVGGLRGVFNHIEVRPQTAPGDVRRRIARALHETADVDARKITVKIEDGLVTLTGTARSWMQREAAERAAGAAPGVLDVRNELVVEPLELLELGPDELEGCERRAPSAETH